MSDKGFDEQMKVRVSRAMKLGFLSLQTQLKNESDLAREAFVEFLQRNGILDAQMELTPKARAMVSSAEERSHYELNEEISAALPKPATVISNYGSTAQARRRSKVQRAAGSARKGRK